MQETAISIPFSFDVFGKVSTTTDQKKIWSDRVRSVVGTNLRERLMRPEFGCLVPSSFMETQDMAASMISTEVSKAFSSQLQSLELQNVDTMFDESTGVIEVTVLYSLPNNDQIDTTVSFVYINSNQPIYEENL
jgi:phage baseplate assembly protein W